MPHGEILACILILDKGISDLQLKCMNMMFNFVLRFKDFKFLTKLNLKTLFVNVNFVSLKLPLTYF